MEGLCPCQSHSPALVNTLREGGHGWIRGGAPQAYSLCQGGWRRPKYEQKRLAIVGYCILCLRSLKEIEMVLVIK